MASEYPIHILTDGDYLPFGDFKSGAAEFPTIIVDGVTYAGTGPLGEETFPACIAVWIAPDNVKEDADYDTARQTLREAAQNIGHDARSIVEKNFHIAGFHELSLVIPMEVCETATVGDLKNLGVFDALNQAAEHVAKDPSLHATEAEFQAMCAK